MPQDILRPTLAPLDPALYALGVEDTAFLKAQTGIQDEAELRDHVLKVQAEAYKVIPYPCIRMFGFAKGLIAKHPIYESVGALRKARPDAKFLDVGCCMGTDIRKVVYDGFLKENVIGTDLFPEFWNLGHKLFKTDQQTYPVAFVAGDISDEAFLAISEPSTPQSPPLLSALTSLTPLWHSLSVIHVTLLFHLLGEEYQRRLAHRLGALLSPAPGSMIFGMHIAVEDTEENKDGGNAFSLRGGQSFTHSPTSWRNIWVGKDGVFKPDEAEVTSTMVFLSLDGTGLPDGAPSALPTMYWSVTKV